LEQVFRMNPCCILDLTMKKPTSVFKFEAFSAQSIQNLKKQIIYFASPRVFNDPYDCSLPPKVLEPSVEELEKYRYENLLRLDILSNERDDLRKISIEELGAIVKRSADSIFKDKAKNFKETAGILAFPQISRHFS